MFLKRLTSCPSQLYVHGKTMENLRNKIDVGFASNEKDYLKWT